MAPAVVASLARQIRQLATAPPDGVKFYPNEKGLSEIDASIDGPGTSKVSVTLRIRFELRATPSVRYLLQLTRPTTAACSG